MSATRYKDDERYVTYEQEACHLQTAEVKGEVGYHQLAEEGDLKVEGELIEPDLLILLALAGLKNDSVLVVQSRVKVPVVHYVRALMVQQGLCVTGSPSSVLLRTEAGR